MLIRSIAILVPLVWVTTSFGQDCPSSGSCLAIHSTPGCDDEQCCNTVCGADPVCCVISWDSTCVLTAESVCAGLCGANASQSCFIPHTTPACDDAACCNLVCALDSFCCDVRWDEACAVFAQLNCDAGGGGECGDPGAGSCFEPHETPACSDLSCCEGVCQLDPTCCSINWDSLCASIALQLCASSCQPICPSGSILELETCGTSLNDPCYFPSAKPQIQTLPCGVSGCGTLKVGPGNPPDIDVWQVNLVDGDGDGVVAVQIVLSAAPQAFACLVSASGCPPLDSAVTSVDTQICIEALSPIACVTPGTYRLVIAPGAWPTVSNTSIPCGDNNGYVVKLLCADVGCEPPCGPDSGPCYYAHKTVGCNDVDCCQTVCVVDPSCCDTQWDSACAAEAIDLCATPPSNDNCVGATVIATGSTPFETFGATDGALGTACLAKVALRDVWFAYQPAKSGQTTAATCGSAITFDSAIAVYGGTCGALQLIACNDDGSGACLPSTASKVTWTAQCGTTYFIRVGGGDGDAVLSLSVAGGTDCPQPCPEDLSGNGTVGPEDLATLLGAWGGTGAADLSGNGSVGPEDLALLLGAWGPC